MIFVYVNKFLILLLILFLFFSFGGNSFEVWEEMNTKISLASYFNCTSGKIIFRGQRRNRLSGTMLGKLIFLDILSNKY